MCNGYRDHYTPTTLHPADLVLAKLLKRRLLFHDKNHLGVGMDDFHLLRIGRNRHSLDIFFIIEKNRQNRITWKFTSLKKTFTDDVWHTEMVIMQLVSTPVSETNTKSPAISPLELAVMFRQRRGTLRMSVMVLMAQSTVAWVPYNFTCS